MSLCTLEGWFTEAASFVVTVVVVGVGWGQRAPGVTLIAVSMSGINKFTKSAVSVSGQKMKTLKIID